MTQDQERILSNLKATNYDHEIYQYLNQLSMQMRTKITELVNKCKAARMELARADVFEEQQLMDIADDLVLLDTLSNTLRAPVDIKAEMDKDISEIRKLNDQLKSVDKIKDYYKPTTTLSTDNVMKW